MYYKTKSTHRALLEDPLPGGGPTVLVFVPALTVPFLPFKFLNWYTVLFWAAAAAANCPALVLGNLDGTPFEASLPAAITKRRHHQAPLIVPKAPTHKVKKNTKSENLRVKFWGRSNGSAETSREGKVHLSRWSS